MSGSEETPPVDQSRAAELERLRKALRSEREEFTDRLLDNVPGGLVVVSPTGAILRANAVAITFLGMPQDILTRREVDDWGTTTLREDGSVCPVEEYPVTRCMVTGQPQPPQIVGVRHPGGEVVWGLFYATPVFAPESTELLGVVVSFLDVTARRRAEEELRRSEARFRTLLENSPDHILLIDEEARALYLNRPSSDFTLEAVLGRRCYEFIPPESRGKLARSIEAAKAGESTQYETKLADFDRHYVTRVAPLGLDADGRWTAMLISTDVTDQRQAESERRHLEARMQQVQRMESLAILAGGVAHDFNNLLLGILGRTELALARLGKDPAVREHLEEARTAALRARDLTDELLAYSGGGTFVVAPFDLNTIVRETVRLLELNLLERMEIVFDLADGLPPVEGDATQLRQVVMNLLTNAAEASPEGGSLVLRTNRIDPAQARSAGADAASLREAQGYLRLEVSDDGEGMSPETIARIFDPFFTTKFTGRGLGLAAVIGIVRGHGGLLDVESEPGKGSTFRIVLPASTRSVGLPDEPRLPGEPKPESGAVLIVDDEKHVRDVSRAILEDSGYTVLTACDGLEALERFREVGDAIEVVVLDLIMPNLNGEETLRALHELRPGLPVILSSGYGEELATRRLPQGAMAGFLKKPYSIHELVAEVRRVTPGPTPESA